MTDDNTPLPEVGDLVQLPQLPPGKYAVITAVTETTITADNRQGSRGYPDPQALRGSPGGRQLLPSGGVMTKTPESMAAALLRAIERDPNPRATWKGAVLSEDGTALLIDVPDESGANGARTFLLTVREV